MSAVSRLPPDDASILDIRWCFFVKFVPSASLRKLAEIPAICSSEKFHKLFLPSGRAVAKTRTQFRVR
jgi:hypothetical protein